MALAMYRGLNSGGFRIAGLFDSNPERVASLISAGHPAYPMGDMKRIVKKEKVEADVARATLKELQSSSRRAGHETGQDG